MIVHDDFVPERKHKLIHSVMADPFLWQDTRRHWWDGLDPVTPVQQLINYLWHERCLNRRSSDFLEDAEEGCGFEYWINQLAEKDSLELHQDHDRKLLAAEGILVHPIFSSVFYPGDNQVSGGELHVCEEGQPEEVLLPHFNRMVILDGTTPHFVAEVKAGIRRSITINVWETPPMDFAELPS